MDQQEAQKKIAELVETAHKAIKEAEQLAIEHQLTFDFSVSYGMGGTFYGDSKHEYLDTHWHPSSHSC